MFKKIMALIDKIPENSNNSKVNPQSTLTQAEIQFILSTLRECTFKGDQVVNLYNTVLKLQQQYKKNEE